MQGSSPKSNGPKDAWETSGRREGYEDRGVFRPPAVRRKEQGSSVLKTLGGIAIVGGLLWGVYLVTRTSDPVGTLRENHGPVAIIALGAITSLLGKYLRV